jgi:hypothetical protein
MAALLPQPVDHTGANANLVNRDIFPWYPALFGELDQLSNCFHSVEVLMFLDIIYERTSSKKEHGSIGAGPCNVRTYLDFFSRD